ncbi:hypothetical protein YC2023_026124 [Brassica napus]
MDSPSRLLALVLFFVSVMGRDVQIWRLLSVARVWLVKFVAPHLCFLRSGFLACGVYLVLMVVQVQFSSGELGSVNVFGASLSRSVLLSGLVSELNFRIGVPHLAWFLQMVFYMWWLLQLVLVLFEVCWFLDPYATTPDLFCSSIWLSSLPGAHPRFVWLSLCKPPVVMGL